MLLDFPNFSYSNPWQVKTIQTSAPMDVHMTNSLQNGDYFAVHISWEDVLLRNCTDIEQANNIIDKLDTFLKNQSKKSRIIWTLHNKTSHTIQFKESEKLLREVIMNHASVIVLMSTKHTFLVPEKYQHKIVIIPHYIEYNRFNNLPKNKMPTYFRYGANREDKYDDLYLKLLNSEKVFKFVSDSRLNNEVDNPGNVITKRRFTFHEADLYAQLSNFSIFFREPKFNSGVLNFMIGSGLAVFHDSDTVRYMDLPETYSEFCIKNSTLDLIEIEQKIEYLPQCMDNISDFINDRMPEKISQKFWKALLG